MKDESKCVGLVRWYYQIDNMTYGEIYHPPMGDFIFAGQILLKKPTQFFYERNEIGIPRLLSVAKEFNIGQNTLIDFLIGKGYLRDQLRPNSKITEKMYAAITLEFYDDKMKIPKSENDVVTFILEKSKTDEIRSHCLQDLPKIFGLIGQNRQKANDVQLLLTEKDFKFLFEQLLSFLSCSSPNDMDEIIGNEIEKRIKSLSQSENVNPMTDDAWDKYFAVVKGQLLISNQQSFTFLERILRVCKILFPDKSSELEKLIEQNSNVEIAHKLWLQDDLNICQVGYIANEILNFNQESKKMTFEKCSDEEKAKIWEQFKEKHLTANFNDTGYLTKVFEFVKEFFDKKFGEFKQEIINRLTQENIYKLWLEGYIDICPVEYIGNIILDLDKDGKKKIFDICLDEDKSNILYSITHKHERIDSPEKARIIKQVLDISNEYLGNSHSNFLIDVLKMCPEYIKLDLWLEDYHTALDFGSFKPFIISLSPNNQKKYLKKVIKYIHEDLIALSTEEITSINLIDFGAYRQALEFDKNPLDYSTSIILNVISELSNQTSLATYKAERNSQLKMYELILKQISEPSDILQISDFFDECEGRCNHVLIPKMADKERSNSKGLEYQRNTDDKPYLHKSICDGRKAIDRQTNKAALSEENGLEFWWCANKKCYQPSRRLHSSEEWENYSLYDFLNILKINYVESDFEIYLNLINKVNRFLNHLKCRSCNHIMRPFGQANYAFWGVNWFHCTNENCNEFGQSPIYITHCLNGKCYEVIDSRDCVRCRPDGYDSSCGWYVCNYCLSCCSDDAIRGREYILTQTGQQYNCHHIGHQGRAICCNKCGSPMNLNQFTEEEYLIALNWFIEKRYNQEYIANSGQRENGKWWFRFRQNTLSYEQFRSKLIHLMNIGFWVPDFNEQNNIYYISESDFRRQINLSIFNCTNENCNNVIDLRNDLERKIVMEKFHFPGNLERAE